MNTSLPKWSTEQLAEAVSESNAAFRKERLGEPLEKYVEFFDKSRSTVELLLEHSSDLSLITHSALDYLTDPETLYAVRYLAAPPISEDDLKTLADDAVLSPSRLRADPEMTQRIVDVVLSVFDSSRFPWIGESREPTDEELHAAIISTAALIATQKTQTWRRHQAKTDQEAAVAQRLLVEGFTQVETRSITAHTDFPRPGEFCAESMFGTRKADLVIGLWDGRQMPLECKVSNSSTNSVKRLNNDAAVKAKLWLQEFGTQTAVPAAMLAGVFKVHNLWTAQADGLGIFWRHRMDEFIAFIESTRPRL